jgi:Zn-finger domain-containing protein
MIDKCQDMEVLNIFKLMAKNNDKSKKFLDRVSSHTPSFSIVDCTNN